jgi:site-specific DNA-cytosine methylase
VNTDYSAVDCQGFAGGMTLGMVQAGWQLAGKRENIGGFGVAGCEVNRHLLGHDWLAQASLPADWDPVPVRMVFGNPPCSGFSTLGVGQGKEGNKYGIGTDALINECMRDLVNYAARCEPEVVVLESVDRMFTRGRELATELRNTLSARTQVSWTLHHVRHDVGRLGASRSLCPTCRKRRQRPLLGTP